jgi:hypothetical protein
MTASPGERALAHIKVLAAEIGPRSAGSPQERAAFDYVAGQLRGWGYAVTAAPVSFAPRPRFAPLFASGALLLALGGLLFDTAPAPLGTPGGFAAGQGVALLAPLWIAALPDLARAEIRRRSRTGHSQNLEAITPGPDSAPTLLLCAHVDSARASAFRARPLLWLQQYILFIALRVAWGLAAVAVLRLIGLGLPELVVRLVAGLALAGAGPGGPALAGSGLLAGAHDNASGVGVLLALAERLAAQPPSGMRVGFVFTGAEETGLHGAEAYAAQSGLAGRRLAVLNVDMVGAGPQLRYVTQDGALRPLATDQDLNDLIRAAQPEARGLAYAARSGDFLPFLRRGLRAGSLQTSGSVDAELAYHTRSDGVAVLEAEALEMTAQAILRIIQLAQERGYPERD